MDTSEWMGDSRHQDVSRTEFCYRCKPHTRHDKPQGTGTHHPPEAAPPPAAVPTALPSTRSAPCNFCAHGDPWWAAMAISHPAGPLILPAGCPMLIPSSRHPTGPTPALRTTKTDQFLDGLPQAQLLVSCQQQREGACFNQRTRQLHSLSQPMLSRCHAAGLAAPSNRVRGWCLGSPTKTPLTSRTEQPPGNDGDDTEQSRVGAAGVGVWPLAHLWWLAIAAAQ